MARRRKRRYNLAVKIRPRFRYGKRLVAYACFMACAVVAYLPGDLAAQEADSLSQIITLSTSSRITVAIADSLRSSTARVGQEFGVVLAEPVTDAWGTVAVPAGTPGTGRVLNVVTAGLVAREGGLLITLQEIQVGGRAYPVRTNSMNIEGGREGWITPLDVQIRTGRTFLFTLVAPLTLPVAP